MLICCTLYMIIFIPVVIFQCNPVHVAWAQWDREHQGTCINLNAEGWVSGACNIIFNIIIIISLPLPSLAKLKMKRQKKIGIILMILGGSL